MYRHYSTNNFQNLLSDVGEVGYVEIVNGPMVYASGLPNAKPREVVLLESGDIGEVVSLSRDLVEILMLSKSPVSIGTRVARTGDTLKVPVGDHMLGTSINPLGMSIYEEKPLRPSEEHRLIDTTSTDISIREKITEPLETGVGIVDMMVPLGMGQRELVIGDRKTGKTEFIQQVMLSQAKRGNVCIYAGIGKLKIDIKKVEDFIYSNKIESKCVVMASCNSDSLGMIYITPYAAMTLAEYFRDLGHNVILILDDLSTHAKFYREIALTSRRLPGRSSYPGDIFYTHSRLLERAGNFKTLKGPKSITCFPVAETIEGDISGYIQTNLMSITDGHIFFDKELFGQGRRPAINTFLSVTRVGRQTQSTLRWGVNRELTSFLTLLEKTQSFVHFGAELNAGIKATLDMGEKVYSFFDQPQGKVIPIDVQIVLFSLIWVGSIKSESNEKLKFIIRKSLQLYEKNDEFKRFVSDLYQSTLDFNAYLGKVTQNQSKLLSYIEYD